MSALLTPKMCEEAWEIILPSIKYAADTGLINKYAGTIVVLDPTVSGTVRLSPAQDNYGVVFTATIDPDYECAKKYRDFAHFKAQQTWRTGLSGRQLREQPWHYQEPSNRNPGDLKWAGAINHCGIIVAFSGVQEAYDEWISYMMATQLVARCHVLMADIMSNDDSFIDRGRRNPSTLRQDD
ncbi:MAG TPA: hypothetical protein VGE30_01750 [Candidatus Saccharimonadales bacterium]